MTGVLDLELTRALPAVDLAAACPANHRVRCLVRVHGRPAAVVDIDVPEPGLTGPELGERLWDGCGPSVRERFGPALDGLDRFPAQGLEVAAPSPGGPTPLAATVVVATRDRPDALRRCLDSLLAMSHLPARVVVVDNAPSDDRAARLVADRYPARLVQYVREDRPGLASAHNAALPFVATPLVAFTDDDVVVDPAWLARLVDGFGLAADVACVTGMIFPAELHTREQWWIEQSVGFSKGLEARVFDAAVPPDDPLFPFTAGTLGSGANMAFTTEHLARVGGFDPALGAGTTALGGDDLAAFYGVVAAGARLVYEPAAIVFHHHRRDFPSLRRQVYGYGAGLTAYLTGVVVEDPARALTMARHAAAGVRRAVGPSSPLSQRRPVDYPRDLVRRERIGMLSGPGRYLRSRWAHRNLRPRPAPVGTAR